MKRKQKIPYGKRALGLGMAAILAAQPMFAYAEDASLFTGDNSGLSIVNETEGAGTGGVTGTEGTTGTTGTPETPGTEGAGTDDVTGTGGATGTTGTPETPGTEGAGTDDVTGTDGATGTTGTPETPGTPGTEGAGTGSVTGTDDVTGTDGATRTPGTPETPEADKQSEDGVPSDGSLAGNTLKFVNLYWETDDLGTMEAVFDGGTEPEVVLTMSGQDRGVYETVIPEGDFSTVAFRQEGSETILPETKYHFYGNAEAARAGSPEEEVRVTSYAETVNNTFYYDMGECSSYWGADPGYEPAMAVTYNADGTTASSGDDYDVVVNPGDMIYFVDMAKVEGTKKPEDPVADRIQIAFLKKGHSDKPNIGSKEDPIEDIEGEVYTMYESRNGIYSAPFPKRVDAYQEIAFQLVDKNQPEAFNLMARHYNFRGDSQGSEQGENSLKFGYFKYKSGYVDTFYYNTSEQDSFWGTHASASDESLDTYPMYVDVTDYTGNGTVADIDNLWISWKGMTPPENLGSNLVYDEEKGYKITSELAQENYRYFQFPYNSGATENTILTLRFKVKDNGTVRPEEYTYKFTFVPRSGKNCLKIDNIWEFNGQMWTEFQVGEIEERTVFFRNKTAVYEEGTLQMRLASGVDKPYVTKEELRNGFGWTDEQIEKYVVVESDSQGIETTWIRLEKTANPEQYGKENLYSLVIPVAFTHAQFRGKAAGKEGYYYSNREAISDEASYPCYYATQTGEPLSSIPTEDQKNPGIHGFWKSVYSADTSGDQSIDIPTDTFKREEHTYYVNTTFYDYYSDEEMNGKKRQDVDGNMNTFTDLRYRRQADVFNKVAEAYYQSEFVPEGQNPGQWNGKLQPIYLAAAAAEDFPDEGKLKFWESGNGQNKWTQKGGGPFSGIVDPQLTPDGKITQTSKVGTTAELPLFNEEFLRGDNSLGSAVGNVYKNVEFPFTLDKNTDSKTNGYWVFNSGDASDALRMSFDESEGYFLKRTGDPITMRRNGFFPFNDQKIVGKDDCEKNKTAAKLNNLFGVQMNIDFSLPEGAQVYNENKKEYEAIRFEFQGDDDTWIFVDGHLLLDMGGNHDAVRGEINFQDGTWTIRRDLGTNYNGPGTVDSTGTIPAEVLESLKEPGTSHRLTMFYMERGLYESNLKLSFNFPRQSMLEVEKEVDLTANAAVGENIFTELLENMGAFQFDLQNMATNGNALSVDKSAGYISPGNKKILYDKDNDAKFEINDGSVEKEGNVYKVEQDSLVEGADPEPENMLKITPNSTPLDVTDMAYLRMVMTNDGANDVEARNLYIGFEDADGNRVGGYASGLGYENEIPSFIFHDQDAVLRLDYRKMSGAANFDWSKVSCMYIGIRRDTEKASAKYTVSTLEFIDSVNKVLSYGFGVSDEQISDYGSIKNAALSPVDGAWYMKQNKKADGTYDTGISRQTDNGTFALANGQKAVFSDKFRTGSYLALEEKNVDPKVFDTQWSIWENGKPVDGKYLLTTRDDALTVQNPLDMITSVNEYPLEDRTGCVVEDGRIEKGEGGTASVPGKPSAATMLYRSYINPDMTSNMATDLSVHVKNTLKYGSITIKKKLTEEMKDQNTGTYPPGAYTFDIYYTNIAGLGLEEQLAPVNGERYVKQTVSVPVNVTTGEGMLTIPNIPAGTNYKIVERPSNGANLVEVTHGAITTHENVAVEGIVTENGKQDFRNAYGVGTAYVGNQEFIFTNEVEPFFMDVQKVWKDGLTDEEREELLGIKEIHIQLQRRVYQDGQDPETNWQVVTEDYFFNAIGDDGKKYLVLTAENDWKSQSNIELPVYDKDTNERYEYRIRELNEDGSLNSYEVSYDEIRNPDHTAGGKAFLSLTYQAINTPVGLTILKNWDDGYDVAGTRPSKIRVKLVGSSEWDPANPDQNITWECYEKLKNKDHVCDENCYVEITEGSGWKRNVQSVAKQDAAGKPYYYRIEAEELYLENGDGSGAQWVKVGNDRSGYEAAYSEPALPQGEKPVTLTVTNTLPLGNLTIVKKDAETKDLLAGVEFKLERLVPEDGKPDEKLKVDPTFTAIKETTAANGRIQFEHLPYGKYKITETKALDGYLYLKDPVYVTIDEKAFEEQAKEHKDDSVYDPKTKTITVTIFNEKGLALPLTGGRGLLTFAVAGILLIGAGTFLYLHRRNSLAKAKRRRTPRGKRR